MPFHKPFEISGIYNLVIWSLGIEVWFCILMPFIVWTSRRIGMRTVLLLFTVLALLSRFFFLPKATAADFEYFALMTTLGSMLLDFVIGMAIAEEFVQTRQIAQRNPWLAIGIAVTAFSFLISDIAWQEQAPLILSAVNEISIVIGLALFVYGLLLTKLDIVRKVFSNWPLQMIGMMCYSLYLWHAPAFWRLHPELNVYRFIRYATLIFSISFLSYRYIEFGFVHDIRRLLPRRQHKSADQELLTAST
jgi:peptidoglycan/LPS O-acetylase OafA/YrhL